MVTTSQYPEFKIGRSSRPVLGWIALRIASVLFVAAAVSIPATALALPSFARQTSLPCAACHTNLPQLNSFGREFKLNGYLLSSGQSKFPHVSFMAQFGFTHTNEGQQPPPAAGFDPNDNFSLNQASVFYGGRVIPGYVGGFVQGTYDGVEHAWAWDNLDIRFAHTSSIGDKDLAYGVTLNNNPTVSDLWNSTPAWTFPYSTSGLAPAPAAAPLIQGGLAQQVLGVGAYGMWNDTVYLEAAGYQSLSANTLDSLGADPGGAEVKGLAPYWRIAGQHSWGDNYLEFGTFGLYAETYPDRDKSQGTDRTADVGVDAQYQYSRDENGYSLLTSFISEKNIWNASKALGFTSNSDDRLYSFYVTPSYLYDKTYGLTVSYFSIWGDSDVNLYGTNTGSPDSNGFIFQLDWLPLNKGGGPSFMPYSNAKISLQYTLYNKFDGSSSNVDGTGRNASDNNTLYLQLWIAF